MKIDKTKLVRSLVKGYKYVPYLDRIISEWDGEWSFTYEPKTMDDAFHPSGDCTPSVYELYHQILSVVADEEKKPIPANTRKAWMNGHFWHQWLQYLTVERLGFADWDHVEREGVRAWGTWNDIPPFRPFTWVHGSADIAPVELPRHGKYLIDYKTMTKTDAVQDVPPARYADKWECQVNIYMDFFDLEKALLVGISKDSPHDLKEWEYHRNQPLIDAIYKKWGLVSDFLDSDEEPSEKLTVKLPLKGTVTR